MATASGYPHSEEESLTHRRDWWWLEPFLTFIAYTAFIVYATYRVFEPIYFTPVAHAASLYIADNGAYHYLSPFGSPDLTFFIPEFLRQIPILGVMLMTPAFLILPFPAGFRFTCYYYRKSYYRAFVARPYACAVPANKGFGYKGERGILVLQNLHRYFLYAALVIVVILTYDALASIFTPGNPGFYFGLGSLILIANAIFLAMYTFGCHSFRHLVGGKLDCFSCDDASRWRHNLWGKVTVLNGRHMLWAWVSLFTVAFSDVYIRYVVIEDAFGLAALLQSLGVPL